MLPELLELHESVLLILPQLIEFGREVAEEGSLLGLWVRVLKSRTDILQGHPIITVVVEPIEHESQHCLTVHEAKGRDAGEVLLEE